MADPLSSDLTSESSRLSASSDTGTERECSSSSTSASLLSRLKAPNPSESARKRKVDSNNPPPNGGRGTVGPKSVSPSQRVQEHPDQYL